jgi:hypothetical protein
MRYNVIAFALLFIILSIASLYSIILYQQVLAQDAQEGQLLSQVKVTRLEYNSSELTRTNSESFLCNIEYNNPTNSTVRLSSIHVEGKSAAGVYPGTVLLNSGYSIVSVELSPKLPNGTSPVFYIKAHVSLSISGRVLSSAVQGGKIENYVIGRTTWNPTYGLLSYYSTLAAVVWIVGLGPAFVVMLFVSRTKLQVERWAAGVFAVNAFSVFAAFVLEFLPKPSPSVYSNYIPPGAGSFFAMIFLYSIFFLGLILGGGLNLYAIVSLLRHSQGAKERSFLAGGFMIVGFILSFLASFSMMFFYYWNSIAFWVFALIAAVNALTWLRLRQIHTNK